MLHRHARPAPTSTVRWIIGVFFLGYMGAALAQVGPAPQGENPLERHRERWSSGRIGEESFFGQVARIEGGRIITDLSSHELRNRGVREQDALRVEILGKTFLARIVSKDTYRGLLENQQSRDALDVDVVGVIGGDSSLIISGLSGNLVEWLGVGPGVPITVRVVR